MPKTKTTEEIIKKQFEEDVKNKKPEAKTKAPKKEVKVKKETEIVENVEDKTETNPQTDVSLMGVQNLNPQVEDKETETKEISLTQKELDEMLSKAKEDAIFKRFKNQKVEKQAKKPEEDETNSSEDFETLQKTVESLKADMAKAKLEQENITLRNQFKTKNIKEADFVEATILYRGLVANGYSASKALEATQNAYQPKAPSSVGMEISNETPKEQDEFIKKWNETHPKNQNI